MDGGCNFISAGVTKGLRARNSSSPSQKTACRRSSVPSLIFADGLTFLWLSPSQSLSLPSPPPSLSPSLPLSFSLSLLLSLVLTLLPTQANREEGVDEAKVEKDAKVGRRLTPRWGHEIVMNTGGINRHSHWPMKCDMGPTMHCIQFLLIEPMVP